ncbi:MAG: divalent-cation tolerance protein CutA [SAR324 cluster bacterium]|nr:divalent-cation tolerance protein CutA [SAR324 cluster bacterium]
MSEYRFVYITASDEAEAARIGEALVRERLAACANVLPGVRSFYWWEGEVQDGREAVLILKTQAALVDRLVQKVQSLHSYSCPCVVALPIENGNPDFLRWIGSETAQR